MAGSGQSQPLGVRLHKRKVKNVVRDLENTRVESIPRIGTEVALTTQNGGTMAKPITGDEFSAPRLLNPYGEVADTAHVSRRSSLAAYMRIPRRQYPRRWRELHSMTMVWATTRTRWLSLPGVSVSTN
jgi:hypothetical protein